MTTRTSPGWILVLGLALFAAGVVQDGRALQTDDPTTGAPALPGSTPGSPLPAFATGDSNDRMIAVTGIDVTGSSLLYLVDTERLVLSVYQATGGTNAMNNVRWVGARKIALDLEVDGFNDRSEYSFEDLRGQFRQNEVLPDEYEDGR